VFLDGFFAHSFFAVDNLFEIKKTRKKFTKNVTWIYKYYS